MMDSLKSFILCTIKIYCTTIYDFILNTIFNKLHNTQNFFE